MKKDEIVVGATYSNGKEGRHAGVRRVIAAGPEYKLYSSQAETDCLAYAVVRGRKEVVDRGKTGAGEGIGHCTRTSFAAWAKTRVSDPA
jgi:hypothetical protein